MVGDGGCIARALVAVGVFRGTAEATEVLNALIDEVHKHPNHRNKPRRCVGVDSTTWHIDVVCAAIKKAHPVHIFKKRQLTARKTTSYTFRCGTHRRFIVIGSLSPTFVCKRDSTLGEQRHGGGSHCAAIVNGRLVCSGLGDGGEKAEDVLWLKHTQAGRLITHHQKGYFSQIGAVYEFSALTAWEMQYHVPEEARKEETHSGGQGARGEMPSELHRGRSSGHSRANSAGGALVVHRALKRRRPCLATQPQAKRQRGQGGGQQKAPSARTHVATDLPVPKPSQQPPSHQALQPTASLLPERDVGLEPSVYYLDSFEKEGLGVFWAHSGSPVPVQPSVCALCLTPGCKAAQPKAVYREQCWYLGLGTTTRYADVRGDTRSSRPSGALTARNPVCFVGGYAVVHLGDVPISTAAKGGQPIRQPAFVVFDRHHIHRAMAELRDGNSICAEPYIPYNHGRAEEKPLPAHFFPFRAKWARKPAGSDTRLFHRWLLLPTAEQRRQHRCVEHINDIALDCREENLRAAANCKNNNVHIGRLKYAYWQGGRSGVLRLVGSIQADQKQYWRAVHMCPPLPDCVFAHKRFRRQKKRVPTAL